MFPHLWMAGEPGFLLDTRAFRIRNFRCRDNSSLQAALHYLVKSTDMTAGLLGEVVPLFQPGHDARTTTGA